MDEPKLGLLKRPIGSTKAIVFVHGSYCQDWGNKDKDCYKLLTPLQEAGWRDAVYHLWWDSSSFLTSSIDWINLNPLKWVELKDRARKVGKKHFSDLIKSKVQEREVSIIAYSLGVRVTYYALKEWSAYGHTLKDAIFLAGAIPRDSSKDWGYAASKLRGTLFNIYNNDDQVLGRIVQTLQGGTSPCGLKPIKAKHSKILNLDATSSIGHHHGLTRYLTHLPQCIEWNA